MGCASSKQIEATVDVYRPAPSSFAVFDINAIQEPWLMDDAALEPHPIKPSIVPAQILDKLNKIESDAPHSWEEVSKALEDLKPTLHLPAPNPNPNSTPNSLATSPPAHDSPKQNMRKNASFHTLEELDAKKTAPKPTEPKRLIGPAPPAPVTGGYKSVRENIFIMKDKMEKEKEGKVVPTVNRWNPLNDFPEITPPGGGGDAVVLYTTSLGGVRRTYEDCNKVRLILESHRAVFEERDVSLHGEFLKEVKELLGDGNCALPRLFVKGRYIGGAEEVVGLNESGKLGRMMNWARVEKGIGRHACEGCGGARFVPCLDCGGSCRLVVGNDKERCPKCNENGLVHCPLCI